MFNQSRGGVAEHHPTRRSDRFHPLCHPDLLTDGGVTERPRTDFTGDHLTGIEADPQLQFDTVALLDLSGKPLRLLLNAQRRQAGANSVILQRHRRAEHRHDPVAGELVHRAAIALHHHRARLTNSAMISRSRSAPTAAAMSIECTTSANSTVTCLYSADRVACVSGVPHSLQNLEFGGSSVPHDPQSSPVAVSPPPPSPLGSTSVSFHCWSAMSVISPCHLRHEVLRPSYLVYFETIQRSPTSRW